VPYREITVDELGPLGPEARIIDVREDDEWAAGHIPWAVHVPLATVPERLASFDGAPTYVICRSGGRSGKACEFAAARELDVVNVLGGMLAWEQAGFDVVDGSNDD
jgi:rhodanese-related sulfurtransferase